MSRRTLLRGAAVGGGLIALNACTGGGNGSPVTPTASTGLDLPPIEGAEVILDPAQFPTAFKESPEFAAQVAAGTLEPVAQRIGQDPLVIKPVHEVGKYGGVLRRGYLADDSTQSAFCSGPDTLLYYDHLGTRILPNIARDFEVSSDNREITLHLRRGMRWSDGQPFTADDILFWRDDINLNPEIGFSSLTLQIGGKDVEVVKLDDYTVAYRSPVQYATLIQKLAGSLNDASSPDYWGAYAGGGYAAKHYLSQFHPKYTSEAEANKLAKDAGFQSWTAYILDRNTWQSNPDLPTLTPWKCTRSINNPPWEFEANPYSIWVDAAGNQLPYIPKVALSQVNEPNVLVVNTISGEYDWADRGIQIDNLPLLYKNADRSDYTVHKAPDSVMDMAVILNLSYVEDQEIGDLIRTVEFRRALSLGIDRDQVNDTYFLESGMPSATMVPDDSPYFPGPEWRTKWATLDIDQANELLDGIGLTKRNGDGFRMLPSGKGPVRIDIQSTNSKVDFPTWGEMIRRHWRKIGVDSSSQLVDSALLYERAQANKVQATLNLIYGVEEPFLNANCVLPYTTAGTAGGTFGIEYSKWFLSGGEDGTEPPESMSLLKDAIALYERGSRLPVDKRADLGKQIMEMVADQVWTIGVIGQGLLDYGIYVNGNNVGNVPARIRNADQTSNTLVALPHTFYFTS